MRNKCTNNEKKKLQSIVNYLHMKLLIRQYRMPTCVLRFHYVCYNCLHLFTRLFSFSNSFIAPFHNFCTT